MDDPDLNRLREFDERIQEIAREWGLDFFSQELNIAPSRFYGVVTFYSQFRLKPTGEHKVVACCGTACHVRGSEKILNALKRELDLTEDEDTTQDGKFTLEKVACLGTCSFAPVVLINGAVHGKAGADAIIKEIRQVGKSE